MAPVILLMYAFCVDDDADFACLVVPSPERPFAATEWLTTTISSHWRSSTSLQPATRLSWAIGSSVGGEALLQSRPSVSSLADGFVSDLLRARAACTLATCRVIDDTPAQPTPTPLRFGRWIGFGELHFDPSTMDRQRELTVDVPSFLTRHLPKPAGEHLPLLLFLADLYQRNVSQSGRMSLQDGTTALCEMYETVAPMLVSSRGSHFAVTDGRYLFGFSFHRRMLRILSPVDETTAAKTLHSTGQLHPAALVLTTRMPAESGEPLEDGWFALDARDPTRLVRAGV